MEAETVGGLESGGGEAVTVVDNPPPTPVMFVDNSTQPTTDETLPANVIPIPQNTAELVSMNSDKKTLKPLQIVVNISGVDSVALTNQGIDSVQLAISVGYSNLNGQAWKIDCTALVPIGGGEINTSGGTAADGGVSGGSSRISDGGGGKTH